MTTTADLVEWLHVLDRTREYDSASQLLLTFLTHNLEQRRDEDLDALLARVTRLVAESSPIFGTSRGRIRLLNVIMLTQPAWHALPHAVDLLATMVLTQPLLGSALAIAR